MEKGQSLQKMVLGKLDSHWKRLEQTLEKSKTGPLPYTIHKNEFKIKTYTM